MSVKISVNFFSEEPGRSLSSDAQILYLSLIVFQWDVHIPRNDWLWLEQKGLVLKNKKGKTLWTRTQQASGELVRAGLLHLGTLTPDSLFVVADQDAIRVNHLRVLKGGAK